MRHRSNRHSALAHRPQRLCAFQVIVREPSISKAGHLVLPEISDTSTNERDSIGVDSYPSSTPIASEPRRRWEEEIIEALTKVGGKNHRGRCRGCQHIRPPAIGDLKRRRRIAQLRSRDEGCVNLVDHKAAIAEARGRTGGIRMALADANLSHFHADTQWVVTDTHCGNHTMAVMVIVSSREMIRIGWSFAR